MNHNRSFRPALLGSLLSSLLLASTAFATTPAEIDSLRAKAEKGNAIAQYNLGLAYADRGASTYDPVEAYVWLNLAADNGATGKALETVAAAMTPAQIAEGRNRLASRHPSSAASPSPVIAADSPIAPVADPAATTAQIEADKKQLSDELASSWKETDRLKASLTAQLADANKRLAIAETALANKDKDIATLQARLAALPAPADNSTELAALRLERDQLRAAATAASTDLATLRVSSAKSADDLAAAQNAQRLAESEAASLKSSADKAGSERLAFAAQLEAANNEATRLRTELDTAKAASAAPASTPAPAAEPGSLSATGATVLKADRDRLADSVTQLTKERDTLAQQLADAKAAAVVPLPANAPVVATAVAAPETTTDTDALKSQLADAQKTAADTQAKLDAALRTYTLNQAEIDRLQKALANIDGERAATADKLDAANKELATLRPQAETATASSAQVESLRSQLADTQRAAAERSAALDQAVKDLAAARQTADASGNDLAAVREQLRQTQAQSAANANENLQLKTRLALSGSAPAAPNRPGTIAPTAITMETPFVSLPATPPPAAASVASAPAAAKTETPAPATTTAAAQPRTYVVTNGDTLSGIAKRSYGNANRWKEILDANKDVIRNPNALTLGTKLRIP